ncbi:group 1 truncated hemoglobin [Halorussus rarus]|uniref:group I truncated hemoglobin n=1 Tax=Halorussus TaxID=1070314 RepID=UPI000E211050|nr:group 1 truncated hemoglobin [Halorussus rarus]NHN59433.1 group 1 truncated hemoglobin [Halorussus sp. JP-T4]
MNDETVFERLGGRDAVESVVDDFYDRVLSDERVVHHFEDSDTTELRAHQVQFIAAVTGGPVEYSGRDMQEAHPGMGITDAEFDVIADHLETALAENEVADEDRQRVLADVEELRPEIVEGRSASTPTS